MELSGDSSREILKSLAEKAEKARHNRLEYWKPYPKQREFHAMGTTVRHRAIFAGNQQGKSECGAAEVAMHATGRYPRWWDGLRLDDRQRPLRIWVGGVTSIVTRDVIQRKLLGEVGEWGTGYIPADAFDPDKDMAMMRGVSGAIDFVRVTHKNGTKTVIYFKSYEQGRQKWQADSIDFLWFDEEPPEEIWEEGVARLTATEGSSQLTFTPLQGMSSVVSGFYPRPNSEHKGLVIMGMKDALHIDPSRYDELLAQYPKHQREARLNGIPTLGSGRIYDVLEEQVSIPPFKIPRYWRRIMGMDIGGGDHPTAWVAMAHDLDKDIVYITDCQRNEDPRVAVNASSMRRAGVMPVAWPKDGLQQDKNEGLRVSDLYRRERIKMLPKHAQFPGGSVSVEAGILEILERLTDGRLRVFSHCADWFEEYRTYHRKKGKIVKERDDLLDATRYAIMMLRYARPSRSEARIPHVVGKDRVPFADMEGPGMRRLH